MTGWRTKVILLGNLFNYIHPYLTTCMCEAYS
uniref:Uncharacterized protein n=1 Tax=Utricularia reniformis TaxID=192314 RepID=A0A1Y0B118_9LAMI|nr:hypothetical protein AEK19_MT0830 [Utricularia reniformis]YP_009382307.1 hypothetical protein AEK19_MT1879 [Utricularia reniformis]ART31063.1 hypothetical protein AEK19_MT0830 [Utricularia reniformis]ART32048.1 hypothetical protein AEK19_MT1879 [Utricularia reniformis]